MKKTLFLTVIISALLLSACSKNDKASSTSSALPFATLNEQYTEAPTVQPTNFIGETEAFEKETKDEQGFSTSFSEDIVVQAAEGSPFQESGTVTATTANPFFEEAYKGPPSAIMPNIKHFSDFPPFPELQLIDYDFSRQSVTMVYGFMYDVLTNAENYVGKSLKLTGSYMPYNAEDGNTYHFLLVYDDAACCELAIELLPTKGSDIAFPKSGDIMQAEGLVDICNDAGTRFVALRINDITLMGL
ncbi:MAG: hypothetical protein Q4E07_06210 [Eubacteriales bacterium]|nr:hypothetical protein [Eubacteriales bacterium]